MDFMQHSRLSCPSPAPEACSNSCPLSQWCHPTISSSVIPFSSCLQSFPASGSFPMSQFFTSDGQSIGASASASVFSMNIQDWFPLGLTGLISLQSKGLSRVFFNTAVQKHQRFGAQLHDYWVLSQLFHSPLSLSSRGSGLNKWKHARCSEPWLTCSSHQEKLVLWKVHHLPHRLAHPSGLLTLGKLSESLGPERSSLGCSGCPAPLEQITAAISSLG